MEKLRPLHQKLEKPQSGDWLYHHQEPGQTFSEYIQSNPVIPRETRRTITVQPLGEFTESQRRIITLTAEFLGLWFNLPVKIEKDLPLSVVPASARRTHPTWGVKQILTTYVLDELLKPRLPKDAFAYIAFTPSDLWPGEGWNFVFGQASLRERVGVWSLSRFGDPSESEQSFRLALLRTLRTGTHELGHMFSMYHCTAYACDMCGSNSLPESDRRPLALCPECMAKVCWATRTDPVERYGKLAAFCEKQGLKTEAARYRRLLEVLGAR
jgi:archaemetzincin